MAAWLGWAVVGTALAVPPGEVPVDHNQPSHNGPPVTRSFRRFPEDDFRQHHWEVYVHRLECAWREYRRAGSTREAFCRYQRALAETKRDYVFGDIYLEPLPMPPRRAVLSGETEHADHDATPRAEGEGATAQAPATEEITDAPEQSPAH